MRLSSTVDSLTKENYHLRVVVKILGLGMLALALTILFLHDQEPIVVERSSRGLEVINPTPLTQTEMDIDRAIRLMLKARFETDAVSPELFLSPRQMELREAEQREMKSRGLNQSVVFRAAKVTKEEAVVEFDRVIAVGDIRSALKTKIKIAFEELAPNELNPYGLRLALASPVESKGETK